MLDRISVLNLLRLILLLALLFIKVGAIDCAGKLGGATGGALRSDDQIGCWLGEVTGRVLLTSSVSGCALLLGGAGSVPRGSARSLSRFSGQVGPPARLHTGMKSVAELLTWVRPQALFSS